MPCTYLATERTLNWRVVIKVLAPELLAGVAAGGVTRQHLRDGLAAHCGQLLQ
jgi:hypothetical protein